MSCIKVTISLPQVWLVCCNLLHVVCQVHQENLSLIFVNVFNVLVGCLALSSCIKLELQLSGKLEFKFVIYIKSIPNQFKDNLFSLECTRYTNVL